MKHVGQNQLQFILIALQNCVSGKQSKSISGNGYKFIGIFIYWKVDAREDVFTNSSMHCVIFFSQHHMLGPVQRVPRYRLLLEDYVKRLPEDSDERPVAGKALQLITVAATHSNETMKKIVRAFCMWFVYLCKDQTVLCANCVTSCWVAHLMHCAWSTHHHFRLTFEKDRCMFRSDKLY